MPWTPWPHPRPLSAERATLEGLFKDQIVPVTVKQKKKQVTIDADEHFRPNLQTDELRALPTAFIPVAKGGTVTAGNASGISDGASALLLMARDRATALGVKPLATVTGIGPLASPRQNPRRTVPSWHRGHEDLSGSAGPWGHSCLRHPASEGCRQNTPDLRGQGRAGKGMGEQGRVPQCRAARAVEIAFAVEMDEPNAAQQPQTPLHTAQHCPPSLVVSRDHCLGNYGSHAP